MIPAVVPVNEAERLRALYESELLDTDYEDDFNDIVQLASQICKVPISLITLIDENREWYKAKFGLNHTHAGRNLSFCSHAILNESFFEITDARTDERFEGHPLVKSEPYIRYYGGIPLITAHGYTLGTLCVIDLVPRKMEPEELYALNVLGKQVMKLIDIKILNKKLLKSAKVQNRTLAVIAHDIKNPLYALQSAYELKQSGTISKEDAQVIEDMIPQQLSSTLTLLDNMVQWGGIQLKDADDAATCKDLSAVCESAFEMVQLSAARKSNVLCNDVPESFHVAYPVEAINFILRNLLANACKFTSNGVIKVSAERGEDSISISVSDTGIGMSEEQLNKIMETKRGITTTGTGNEKGSGLGLMLIFEYLADIRGELKINSVQGEGTTCTITFPD